MTRAETSREAKLGCPTGGDIALKLITGRRLARKVTRLLLHLGAGPMEHGHSNKSCDCPYGHKQTCEGCGSQGAEDERS
jgi:hypothetical protein